MKIANLSIRRPVTITMVMLAIAFIGIFAVLQLPEELTPSLDLPVAAVITSWASASPDEVEQQVTSPIEQAMESLSSISDVTSTSEQGSSIVIVDFDYGVDMNQEVDDMRDAVSRIQKQLPTTVTVPEVVQFNPSNRPIMQLALYGPESQQAISDLGTNIVEPALVHLNGVSGAGEAGNLTRQITVDVNPQKLTFYHLAMSQVVQAISSDNLTADAGQVQKGNLQIPLEVEGQFTSPSQLDNVPISLGGGHTIPLSDVATVVDGTQPITMISTVNGKPAISFSITQATGSNTVQVSDEVHKEVAILQRQLPAGMHLQILSDSAQTIRQTINTVINHTVLGFIFGVLVILLILRSVKTTFVVAVAIPIAVLATFILMYFTNLTLNSTTLGSLAVGLGSLVDFSIVVLESIFRARQRGLNPVEAAKLGTKEVGLAVVVAALAQICVFAPAILVPGIAGQFFAPVAMTVSFSHIAALFVALTFTPMLASRVLRGRRFEMEETVPGITAPFRAWAPFDWFGRGMHDITQVYQRILRWSLKHRAIIVVSAAVMFCFSLFLIPQIGFELVPNVGNNQMSISVTMPDGADLQATNQVVQEVESLAKQHMKGIQTMDAEIGSASFNSPGATDTGSINLTFDNSVQPGKIAQMAHAFGSVVSNIPGAQILVSPGTANTGFGASGVEVEIQGPDMQTLSILSQQVADIMERTPGLEYVDNQLATGIPDYQLNISQTALTQYGLTEQQVESTLNAAIQGSNASTFYQGNQQYNIVVQLPTSFTENLNNLSQITVQNSAGQSVPVTELGTITTSQQPPEVTHDNGVRAVTVTATPYGATAGRIQSTLAKELKSIRVPQGYNIGFGQNGKFLSQAFGGLGAAFLASIVLMYMVMASLFESFLTPFVIMFCLPPTIIGAALGLFLTHRSLNIDSAIGLIMVMGLIANNAIVLIDYTNQLRASGLSLSEALAKAGPIRLRPILMSTLTTVLAMMPLVIGYGTGASTLASMATVIAFGLTFSTLVTLVLVPVVYMILDKYIHKLKHWFSRRRPMNPPHSPSVDM